MYFWWDIHKHVENYTTCYAERKDNQGPKHKVERVQAGLVKCDYPSIHSFGDIISLSIYVSYFCW